MSKRQDSREFGNLTIRGNNQILEKITMEILGSSLATGKTPQMKTSGKKHKARFSPKTIEEIKKEAKKLIFFNSAKYLTAKKQSDEMMKPKETILFRNSSNKINHPHAARVTIHEPQ